MPLANPSMWKPLGTLSCATGSLSAASGSGGGSTGASRIAPSVSGRPYSGWFGAPAMPGLGSVVGAGATGAAAGSGALAGPASATAPAASRRSLAKGNCRSIDAHPDRGECPPFRGPTHAHELPHASHPAVRVDAILLHHRKLFDQAMMRRQMAHRIGRARVAGQRKG